MSKTIRIIKCSDPSYWYKGKEGESFSLLFEDREEYVVKTNDGYTNIVRLGDGVEEEGLEEPREARSAGSEDD